MKSLARAGVQAACDIQTIRFSSNSSTATISNADMRIGRFGSFADYRLKNKDNLMMISSTCLQRRSRGDSTPRGVRKNRSVERLESAHSMPYCSKHLKGLEPLHTRFVCFWTCITPTSLHFSLELELNINKNRSTLSVGGLWETDAPKGTRTPV